MSWMPHGMCFAWDQSILWARVLSDGLIALAYFSIPLVLMRLSGTGLGLQFRPFFIMFAAFICACGATHVLDILTLWNPIYRIDAAVRVVTAILSVATAIGMWCALPILARLWLRLDAEEDGPGGR